MNDYLLFLDTETSGLPRKWDSPYYDTDNWPCAVQISWLVFSINGKEILRENHYIGNNDFQIDENSRRIHGISPEMLSKRGEDRKAVMQLLQRDLQTFQPLIVGHFVVFDVAVLGAEFVRCSLPNYFEGLQLCCTMDASRYLLRNPQGRALKLPELYHLLFSSSHDHPHNALFDACATAECFFEMLRRGEITDKLIMLQQNKLRKAFEKDYKMAGISFLVLLIFVLSVIIAHFL